MAVVVTGTLGLCFWIILWSLGVSGLDGMLVALLMVAITITFTTVSKLSSRKDRE